MCGGYGDGFITPVLRSLSGKPFSIALCDFFYLIFGRYSFILFLDGAKLPKNSSTKIVKIGHSWSIEKPVRQFKRLSNVSSTAKELTQTFDNGHENLFDYDIE